MHDAVSLAVFILAAALPFYVMHRRQGGGFVFSILFGWGIIHVHNIVAPRHEPVDAVFVGVWAVLGWAFMSAWCIVCALVVALIRFVLAKRARNSLRSIRPSVGN